MEAMIAARIYQERKAAKQELNSLIQDVRTEFNEKLETEIRARIQVERRVVELMEKFDAKENARIEMERRHVVEVAELLKPGVEAFLVEVLGVEHEARYDALMEEANNVRVEQDAKGNALQKKLTSLSSEVSTLQDSALRNSSTLDAILERGDLTDREIVSLREWLGSMREGHVSLHGTFQAYQHPFFLERLTDSDHVAKQEDPQEKENSQPAVQDSPGSVAQDPHSFSVDPDSLYDDSEGSESNHENSPGSESDDESEDDAAANDYSDDEDDPREIDSGKQYYRSRYNWGWVDDDEEGTVG